METAPTLPEFFISIDVETAGPNPFTYSLLTIGACTLAAKQSTFYVELKPVNMNFVPEALSVSRLSMERLAEKGVEPAEAMRRLENWVKSETPEGTKPVFVAFNAPFDWMFVNDYFHRFLGRNPFGHTALDVKSYYMGIANVPWAETNMKTVGQRYLGDPQFTHHALRDAMDQGEIFKRMMAESKKRKES